MAISISAYNHTARKLFNKEINYDQMYVMLLDNTATFDATDVTVDDVAGALAGSPEERPKEVYGNGWSQDGELIENVSVTTVTTDDAKLDGDDIEVVAVGGSIGPGYYALIYYVEEESPNELYVLALVDFDGAQEAGETTNFVVRWSTNGIIPIIYTAP